ncbi:glycosyltransferase [Niabella sp. CC-SYL272]|uniref:glycosyltransferase n=1 Tax=Niabella agricola TaxID=2891571 RepID=UPI001F1C0C5B|nr:glycosyltransferase [Niabella agricola]MCF3108619.1 glycosyltransferase [Niabella agricola]
MKILLIQHQGFINGQGGTEKVCSFLADHFAGAGHAVEIATCENRTGKAVYVRHPHVTITNIYTPDIIQKHPRQLWNYTGKNPLLWIYYKIRKKRDKLFNHLLYKKLNGKDGLYLFNLQQRASAWKQFIDARKPDLIMTMSLSSVLEITYNNTYAIPIVNSTNGRPDYDYTDLLWYRSSIDMYYLKAAYRHLAVIQVLFSSYRSFIPETFKGKCFTIPNPVPQIKEEERADLQVSKKRYKIVSIASLITSCKQQDLSIEIFSAIAHIYPEWDLFFWGTGPDEKALRDLIKKKGLQNRIFLEGFTSAPLEKLKQADIFIFPSKFEGFPLALTEAMASGLPCLGLRSCSGVNELIQHGENGFLATDQAELQQQLEILISQPETRSRMGTNAHLSMQCYAPETVIEKWNALIWETHPG